TNAALDAGRLDAAAIAEVQATLRRMDEVLAFIYAGKPEADDAIPPDIQALLDERAAARAAKNWAESDRIRDQLKSLGWEVKDSKQGQKANRL
ncbi:MAG: cysteine--tRNA ligase, partial [Kiritimatiellae bacterium]|nr:cysteine--tRNA ligase [Kiritimatiellia bacterium]